GPARGSRRLRPPAPHAAGWLGHPCRARHCRRLFHRASAVSREFAVARLQSDFVSAVSHEFRTPLTSLRQFTDLLNDDAEPPAEKRRACYRAQARATERLHRLVESLLDFGRMEAGARPYRLERRDAAELVRSVVDEFEREAVAGGFTVERAIEPQSGAVDA